jgi:class 3 adenylate cyclase
MAKSLHEQIVDLKNAIEAQETMRSVLGDAVVDTTLTALRGQLAELETRSGAEVTQQDSATPPRRKLVTVLFADISGFTALSERMDAEDLANLVNQLWGRFDKIIEGFGGEIDKHIGDAVMSLFGTPTAREDDPERAIRAALTTGRVSGWSACPWSAT